MLIEVLGALAVLALWDYGRRRLASHDQRQDKLLAITHSLKTSADTYASKLDDTNEYMRLVLSNFINSATDIITISEEEKKHLRNRLAASKLNK